MTNIIGLKQLRENAENYIAEVKRGKSFMVVRKSKPIFMLVSPEEHESQWETVIDFTEFYREGIPARLLLKKLRALHGKT